jgi:hypothetical protein
MGELRVSWGDSDRKASGPSVDKSVNRPGRVWVVVVKRMRVDEWRAMWYFGTRELAEDGARRALGYDGNGGIVIDADVAEGRAYLAGESSAGTARRPVETQNCPKGCGYALPLTGICENCD